MLYYTGMNKRKRTPKKSKEARIIQMEALKGKSVQEIREDTGVPIPRKLEVLTSSGGEVVRNVSERERKRKILARLEDIVYSMPDKAPKYSDIIKAMELIAKLDGLIDKGEGAKHLHIHGTPIREIDERALRDQLAMLSEEGLE